LQYTLRAASPETIGFKFIEDDYKLCERLYKFIGKNRSHNL